MARNRIASSSTAKMIEDSCGVRIAVEYDI